MLCNLKKKKRTISLQKWLSVNVGCLNVVTPCSTSPVWPSEFLTGHCDPHLKFMLGALMIAADISCNQWMCTIILKGLFWMSQSFPVLWPHSGELRTKKVPSDENTELKGSPFKAGVGQYIAMLATLTARDFFLADFYPSGPFTCIFSKSSSDFFPVLAVASTGCCVGPQNKIGHPAGCRFLC